MFSQTPERQASASRATPPRAAQSRSNKPSAAKGFTEVGKTVIEQAPPAAAETVDVTANTDALDETA